MGRVSAGVGARCWSAKNCILGNLVDVKNPDPEIQEKNDEDFITIDGVRYFCTGGVGQVNK